jgi:hypothetical protein
MVVCETEGIIFRGRTIGAQKNCQVEEEEEEPYL